MSSFQIILIALLSAVALWLVALLRRGSIGRIAGASWIVVVVVGILFAIDPNSTTRIARSLGISRGTDLLLYLLVVAVLYGFLLIYLKLRRVRRELTLLVREIAIRDAHRADDAGARGIEGVSRGTSADAGRESPTP